ncbi:MAG: hypothetical protein COV31_01250 [Candidatus Yanofskybacteria bacterium CG10_big_fil_rev_8_21_14_0_10_46_23]|uniref:Uncharacterized protein n=1 Tax=Candidatus Yanofskybacteria bacterium CG10_big_fil_rev_8_21_14_0_10_46_23 TaxID=1975098 RepID=A0A2H0R4N0_9BACT|nr:MAG: hypothetical protein COV31_01250 [Candidatus Yanofskybacteria bacterium CG10_big_fil_rev_8_21_14_0_10_46_23]
MFESSKNKIPLLSKRVKEALDDSLFIIFRDVFGKRRLGFLFAKIFVWGFAWCGMLQLQYYFTRQILNSPQPL